MAESAVMRVEAARVVIALVLEVFETVAVMVVIALVLETEMFETVVIRW